MIHQPNDKDYAKYLRSGVWKCPAGGAHKWVHIDGFKYRCTKCPAEREFLVPDYLKSQITVVNPRQSQDVFRFSPEREMRRRQGQPIGVADL